MFDLHDSNFLAMLPASTDAVNLESKFKSENTDAVATEALPLTTIVCLSVSVYPNLPSPYGPFLPTLVEPKSEPSPPNSEEPE